MVFVSSSDTEIVMLTMKSNLQFLCQNDVQIFGDGTFQYCVFFSLSVIYTSCLPKRTVYTMCVIPPSTQEQNECYIEMFQYLLDVCTQENVELNIMHLNLDFEYAAHEAARHFGLMLLSRNVHSIWLKPGTEKYKVLD